MYDPKIEVIARIIADNEKQVFSQYSRCIITNAELLLRLEKDYHIQYLQLHEALEVVTLIQHLLDKE